jgi:hypothetical protein
LIKAVERCPELCKTNPSGQWKNLSRVSHPKPDLTRITIGSTIALLSIRRWECEDMLIAGLVVFLFILGLFLQAMTASPSTESEWQLDTDTELPVTPAPADDESTAVIA